MDALLKNLVDAYSSQDGKVRKAAENQVIEQISGYFPDMMGVFGNILSSPQQPDAVKIGVLTFLSRIFKDKTEEVQLSWLNRVPAKTQQAIRQALFAGLTNPTLKGMCLTCVVALAALEMPRELWSSRQINELCELSKRGDLIGLRAIGGICQDVNPSSVNPYVTRIAETLYTVLTTFTSNPDVIKCVLETLGSSMSALEFVFNDAGVRDNLVKTVAALLGCQNEDVIVAAFKTLESFMEHGYFHMEGYLEGIFKSTQRILAMKSVDANRSSAICAALDFWFATADRECDVIAEYAKSARGVAAFAPKYYIRAISRVLVPELLECLGLLDDDDAEELDLSTFEETTDYVPAVAYGCLNRVFACAAAEAYELSSQAFFADLHATLLAAAGRLLKAGSWKGAAVGLWVAETAAAAFTPEQVQGMAATALASLSGAQQALVRALAAQVLGALVEAHPGAMGPAGGRVIAALAGPLRACTASGGEGARIVGLECCGALEKVAEAYSFKNVDDPAASPLAAQGVFEGVTQACLAVGDEEVQPKAYGVVTAFIASEVLPQATLRALGTFAETLLSTIERAQAGTADAALEARVACVNACITQGRLESDALIRRLLTILNGTFSNNTLPLTQERALETIAAVVDALEKRFDAYADGIKEGIAALALNTDEPAVAKKAVEVISHMANVNNPKLDSFRYFESTIDGFFRTSSSIFMPGQTSEVRSLGAPYISLFSDFANYMEDRFIGACLQKVMELFTKYAMIKVDRNDDDYCDFVYGVRLSISRFFLTVVTKFVVTGKLGNKTQVYVSAMMRSVVDMNSDGDPPAQLGASALTIVTNLARATKTNFRSLFKEDIVKVAAVTNMVLQVYTDARDSGDTKTFNIANDAVNALREAGIQL